MTYIRKGSVIDVIAMSSKPDKKHFEEVENYIKSLGFIPRIAKDIVSDDEPFYANTAQYRANAFKEAILAPDSDIIWAIRGGRGAIDVINYLQGEMKDFVGLSTNEQVNKLLIGFSDVTTLHSYLIRNFNIITLHADMLERIVANVADKSSVEKLENLLQNNNHEPIIYELTKISQNDIHVMNGKVFGGNLTLVSGEIGLHYTSVDDYENNFLLLEDIGSSSTGIDRDMSRLINSSKLNNIKAVIFADFVPAIGDNPDISQWKEGVKWAIDQFVNKISATTYMNDDIGVFVLDGIGHGNINNPIFLNADSTIYKENDKYFIQVQNDITIIEI